MSNYTQKAIIQTFQDMLIKMPFDKITVSAIVLNCEISSNTFYYHYRDIYDLLDTWLLLVKKKYVTDTRPDMSWKDAIKELLRDMKSNSDLVYHLFNSLSRERLERYIFESVDDTFYKLVCRETSDVSIPEKELRNIAEYNSYSFVGFFLKFLWNHMKDDIDEGVEKIGRIFEGNLRWLKEKYMQE